MLALCLSLSSANVPLCATNTSLPLPHVELIIDMRSFDWTSFDRQQLSNEKAPQVFESK